MKVSSSVGCWGEWSSQGIKGDIFKQFMNWKPWPLTCESQNDSPKKPSLGSGGIKPTLNNFPCYMQGKQQSVQSAKQAGSGRKCRRALLKNQAIKVQDMNLIVSIQNTK